MNDFHCKWYDDNERYQEPERDLVDYILYTIMALFFIAATALVIIWALAFVVYNPIGAGITLGVVLAIVGIAKVVQTIDEGRDE